MKRYLDPSAFRRFENDLFLLWSLTGMLTYDTRVLLVMLVCSLVIFKVSHTEWKQVGTVFQFILLFLCINMLAVWLFSRIREL